MMALNPTFPDWRGQRVWVIGASYGIGAALAAELIGRGARVALSARSEPLLAQLAASTPRPEGAPVPLVAPLDVTDAASVRSAAVRVREAWQGLDLVLVVAGTHSPMRAETFDLATARKLLDVNLGGVFNVLDATLPALLRQGSGGIALVSSVAGYVGLPQSLAYGPTKAALINLAESLYGDLHPRGLGVYLVNPGFVDTPLTQKNEFHMPALMQPLDAARATLDGIARGRFEIHYPRRFTLWLKLLRLLPYGAQFGAVRRITGN
jgi:NAD(P)-dependent dehydrogenase (short-subunit alcohol dehydrogenase family)